MIYKLCPFCKSGQARLFATHVVCFACGAGGPISSDPNKWNSRAPQPATDRLVKHFINNGNTLPPEELINDFLNEQKDLYVGT